MLPPDRLQAALAAAPLVSCSGYSYRIIEERWRHDPLSPYYWRNDYLGIEQHSRYRDDEGNLLILACLQRRLEQFADLWDNNLRSQGFVEAFRRSRKPNLSN